MTDIVIEIANKLELEVELNNGTVVKNAVNIAVEDADDHFIGADVETVLAEVGTSLENKVDKVTGKGLSTNDYTDDEKSKLSGIAENAEVNVNADWNATDGDGQILNKPSTFPPDSHTHDDRYFTETEVTNALALKANKAQEAWITSTLLNGWTSVSGRDVQYMKDEMGFVHFRGDLDPSTKTGPIVFSVPIGYRPSRNEYINIGNTSGFIGCNTSGVVTVSINWTTWQTLNYFKYRAG